MSEISNAFCNQDESASIRDWLKELLQDDDIMSFKENTALTEAFRQIMCKSKEAEKDVREVMKVEKKLTEDYKNKTEELNSILSAEPLSLKAETVEAVKNVATVARKLHLNEPTLTNFVLALNEAENKEMKIKEQEIIENYHLASLSRKVKKVMETNTYLSKDLENLEKIADRQQAEKPKLLDHNSFLGAKIEDYKNQIKKCKTGLSKRNHDSSLEHNCLIKKAEAIDKLGKEVASLQFKINKYQNLPPNETLTRQKIEDARNELSALQEEFDKMLDSYNKIDT